MTKYKRKEVVLENVCGLNKKFTVNFETPYQRELFKIEAINDVKLFDPRNI